jgi:hypothetical protein
MTYSMKQVEDLLFTFEDLLFTFPLVEADFPSGNACSSANACSAKENLLADRSLAA